ncbi:MAG: type II toxin-antitoxin system VapC family toxin [Thermoproteota archaeon]|jgi:predicted nucleic acid-binding protein|nr:type II toxin-antitoxin system VapC family toxin [Thermoproteota archaeon]
MKFVDASVFVHAFIKPKRELKPHEIKIKQAAQKIVKRINEGEKIAISVVNMTEIANILEAHMSLDEALSIEEFLIRFAKLVSVNKQQYLEAIKIAKEKKVGLNDALTYVIMLKNKIYEIYSFDKDFDKLEGIQRLYE